MYRSCSGINQFGMYLISNLYEDGITVAFCCFGSAYKGFKIPGITFGETPEETMQSFIRLRERLLEEITNPASQADGERVSALCEKCPLSSVGNWTPSDKIRYISIAMYPSPCNIRCTYCTVNVHHHSYQNTKFVPEQHEPLYEKYFELLEYARSGSFIADDATYEVGPGEIAIHPYKDRIMDYVGSRKAIVFSNCVKYYDRVAKNLHANPDSYVFTSLDCGTADTWTRIKGAGSFAKTVSNIEAYASEASHPGQIHVKYILLPGVNTNVNDYSGAISLVKRLGINRLVLSRDLNVTDYGMRDTFIKAGADFVREMQKNGVEVGWNTFDITSQQDIMKLANETKSSSTSAVKHKPAVVDSRNPKPPEKKMKQANGMEPSNLEGVSFKPDASDVRKHKPLERKNMNIDLTTADKLFLEGKYEESLQVCLALTKRPQLAPLAYWRIATISNITGDPETAENLYYKAFELLPEICGKMFAATHPNRGYVFKGKIREALHENCVFCGMSGIPRWCYPVVEAVIPYVYDYNPIRTWMFCRDCHHMWAREFPPQKTAGTAQASKAGMGYDFMPTKPEYFSYYSELLNRLATFLPPEGNDVLEVGIGGGECMLVARELGFNVTGIDIAVKNVEQARKLGLDARVMDFLDMDTSRKYQLVILGDVIEHVPCPLIAMEKVSKILAEGGVLWISTPNFDGAFANWRGHVDPMRREASHKLFFRERHFFCCSHGTVSWQLTIGFRPITTVPWKWSPSGNGI